MNLWSTCATSMVRVNSGSVLSTQRMIWASNGGKFKYNTGAKFIGAIYVLDKGCMTTGLV